MILIQQAAMKYANTVNFFVCKTIYTHTKKQKYYKILNKQNDG